MIPFSDFDFWCSTPLSLEAQTDVPAAEKPGLGMTTALGTGRTAPCAQPCRDARRTGACPQGHGPPFPPFGGFTGENFLALPRLDPGSG